MTVPCPICRAPLVPRENQTHGLINCPKPKCFGKMSYQTYKLLEADARRLAALDQKVNEMQDQLDRAHRRHVELEDRLIALQKASLTDSDAGKPVHISEPMKKIQARLLLPKLKELVASGLEPQDVAAQLAASLGPTK